MGNERVPTGFFELPDAENVSAVLFSNSGTTRCAQGEIFRN